MTVDANRMMPPAYEHHRHASETARQVAEDGLILRTEVGSSLHGTGNPGQDDRDEMGICLEPSRFVTGVATIPGQGGFEQFELHTAWNRPGGVRERSGVGDLDITVYSARKWAQLALGGNPTVLMVLFARGDSVMVCEPSADELRLNAHRFVSRKAASAFLGYLQSQMGGMTGVLPTKTNRPELIALHGYDTKYAMHAMRLGIQGVEFLETGNITLPMPEPDRSFLRSVRAGEVPLEDAVDVTLEMEEKLVALKASSSIPLWPDHAWVNGWLHRSYMNFWASLVADE